MNRDTTLADGRLLLENILSRSKNAKQAVCRETPMTDSPAMAFIVLECEKGADEYDDLRRYCDSLGLTGTYNVGFAPLITDDEPVRALNDLLTGLAGNIDWAYIFVVVEGYCREMTELPTDHESGRLEDDFRNNPFTDVREGIIISGTDREGRLLFSSQNLYRYDDFGVPTFDDEQYDTHDVASLDDAKQFGRMGMCLIGGAYRAKIVNEMGRYASLLQTDDEKGDR